LNIVVLGWKHENHIVESWRPDTVEGLRQLGHRVTATLPNDETTVADIRHAARDADMLLWLKDTPKSPDREVRDCLRELESRGVVTVGLHMDLFHGLSPRQDEIGKTAWWSCQYVFTADGGPRDWRGVNHRWFPPAFGTRYLGLAPTVERYRHQAVFVGRPIPRLHGRHRSELLAWAEKTFGAGYALYGTRRDRKVWGWDLNRLYASADIVLGDSADAPYYWSDRIPRTLGRGGILAHPYVEGMDEQGFTDETLIRFPRGEFDTILDRYTSMSDREIRDMRDAAITLIGERHTWKAAMERVLKEVGLCG